MALLAPETVSARTPDVPQPHYALNKWDATADPTVNDDSADGYEPGSYWFNTTAGTYFVCLDATAGAADWAAIATGAAVAGKKPYLGFPYDPDTGYEVTLSYSDANRQVTITPDGASFDVWINGVKYTFTGAQVSTAHADTTDEYFVYYNESGVLTTSTSPWDLLKHAPVCSITYNATTNTAPFPLMELHTARRDPELHYRLHFGGGTVLGTRLGRPTFNGTGTPQFTATAVQVLDEDIELDTDAFTSASNRVVYLNGASAEWTEQTNTFAAGTYAGQGVKFLNNGTNICYNQYTGGAWQKTAVSNNKFVNQYLMASTHITQSKRYWVMPGQAEYSTLNEAQNEAPSTLSFPNTSPEEYCFVARVTFSRKTSNTANNLYANIESIAILEGAKTSIFAGSGVTVHNSLSSLQGGTTGEYYHLTSAQATNVTNISTDPNADRIAFWDDSAGSVQWLEAGSGLSISGTTLSATGGGMTIGNAVTGGGANRVLYEDGSQNLAASANFTFNGSTLVSTPKVKVNAQAYNDTVFEIQATGLGFAGDLFYAHSDDAGGGTLRINYAGKWFLNGASGNATVNVGDAGYLMSAIQATQSTGNVNDVIKIVAGSGGVGGNLINCLDASSNSLFAVAANGNGVAIGHTSPSAAFHVIKTTEQLRLGYDGSNYFSTTVGSTGGVTFDAVGSGAGFTFSDDVTLADAKNLIFNTTTGTKIGTATTQKLGFFNATPIARPASAGAITDSIGGGSAGGTITSVTGADTVDLNKLEDVLSTLALTINDIRSKLVDLGLIS